MKVSYIFPIIDETTDVEKFFKEFSQTKVYKDNKDNEVFFVVGADDKKNLEYLNSVAIRREEIKIFVSPEKFEHGQAVKMCLPHISGDILLLGDTKCPKLDLVFEKMISKHAKGANIVQTVKKHSNFADFFIRGAKAVYNFFVKIYTGKKDSLAITSIELIDRLVLDILLTLQNKANFLRLCDYLEGIEIKKVYIDSKLETQKQDLSKRTLPLIFTYIISGVFAATLLSILFVNIFSKANLVGFNFIMIGILFVCLIFFLLAFTKHILNIRASFAYENIEKFDMVNVEVKKKWLTRDWRHLQATCLTILVI